MPGTDPKSTTDLHGVNRLVIDAIVGVAGIVEEMHLHILDASASRFPIVHRPLSRAASWIYRGIRGVTQVAGSGMDILLSRLIPLLGKDSTWPGRNAVLSVLNGVLGDYLATSGNPLAINMQLRSNGKTLSLARDDLAAALPGARPRILVLVHGLCMNDLQWRRRGHDHGAALADSNDCTPVYLYYNTGRHISDNGRDFALQLESLIAAWPVAVEEISFLCHSMGGLVTRSAWHNGSGSGHQWCEMTRKMVFLGTPHHGAPLERGGNWFHTIADISRYTAPLSRLGKIRSAGITDLRYGSVLEEDWKDRDRFAREGDCRHPAPLPERVACFAIAATMSKQRGVSDERLAGDGLVPLQSALGRHERPEFDLHFPADRQWIVCATGHLGLLNSDAVSAQLMRWLQ
jgi:pimeloyl-ACP methyl ester carboxylesterase